MTSKKRAKPFMPWAGSKRRMLPYLHECLPAQQIDYYVEPFLGGGSMFWSMHGKYKAAYLADFSNDIANMYAMIAADPDTLIEKIRVYFGVYNSLPANANPMSSDGWANKQDYFNSIKDDLKELQTPSLLEMDMATRMEHAAYMLFIMRNVHFSAYRTDKDGKFSGGMRWNKGEMRVNYDFDNIYKCSEALSWEVDIRAGEYRSICAPAYDGAFYYMDPPYYGVGLGYGNSEFGEQEHTDLQAHIDLLASRGANVMLSHTDCDLIRDLYPEDKYTITSYPLSHTVSHSRKIELVITSYEPEGRL